MSGLPGLLWCGAGAPIVEGFLIGLGVATVGLIVFPFRFSIERPAGRQTSYSTAKSALRWAKVASWLLALLSAAALVGYLVIYVGARGKYCDARTTPAIEHLVVPWAITAVGTIGLLIVSIWLRRLAHDSRS
jgi:hypothetical protein